MIATCIGSRQARRFFGGRLALLWSLAVAQLAIAAWILAFIAASLIIAIHPGLSAPLDRVAILTIAGMNLVAVSVTFGVLGIQTQHLAETYTRAVAHVAARRARWPTILAAQALGIVYVVFAALLIPTLASGAAATVLLGVGLASNGFALYEFLQRFDPIRLLRLIRESARAALQRVDAHTESSVVSTVQPILDLIIRGAEKSDTEVVEEGMSAWRHVLQRYLQVIEPGWNDQLLEWLFARCEELVETYAPRSAGVVLPTLIVGTRELGVVCARYVNPLNRDLDMGTHSACRVLRRAVLRSINAHLSPSADLATAGITRLGEACIEVGKVTTLQEPIRILRSIGTSTTETWPHVASRACAGLAQLAIEVAETGAQHIMAEECVGQAIEGIAEMVGHPDQWAGPANAVTVPLGTYTLPRLCRALAGAGAQDRDAGNWTRWDGLLEGAADVAFGMPGRDNLSIAIRSNALQCCQEFLLVLLSLPYRQVSTKIVADRFKPFVAVAIADDGRLHGKRLLGELLLFAYYRSFELAEARLLLRQLITESASSIAGLDVRHRRRLVPILRRVGAAAIHLGDDEIAQAMAKASLPPQPTRSKAIHLPEDLFEPGDWWGETFHHRPGLPDLRLKNHHLDSEAQRKYLELERQIDRHQGR